MQIERQSRVAVSTSSQRADETRPFVNEDSQNPQARKRSSRGGRCVFFGQIQDPHHHRNAKNMKDVSAQFLGQIDDIHGQRKIKDMLGPPPRRGNPDAILGLSLSKNNTWTPLYIRPKFFSQQFFAQSFTIEVYHIGLAKFETACQKKEGSSITKDDKQFTSRL